MRINIRAVFATFLALIMVLVLASAALFLLQESANPEKQVKVRKVALAMPPPPPPPPAQKTVEQPATEASINLNIDGQGVAVPFEQVSLAQDLQTTKLPEVQLDSAQANLLDNLNVDWQAFGLAELDGSPRLLNQLRMTFPQSLTRRGIVTADVELDVMIDEQGKVLLRRIIANPHPELRNVIENLVRQARFSIPKKDGQPVRAIFSWPLELADS